MRTKFLYAWAMAFAVCTFVGCSDDDKPLIPPTDLNTTFGTDDKTQLTLNYSDTPLTGKQVKFETIDSRTAIITLLDVIPGEAQTVISNVELVENNDEYTFTGNTSTTTRSVAAVEYSGSVKKGALTLNLKVTMANASAWAKTYGLAELVIGDLDYGGPRPRPGAILAGSVLVDWSTKPAANGFNMGKMNASTFRGVLGGLLLPQLVKSIVLEADGNIRAEYSSDAVEFNMTTLNKLSPEMIAELVAKKTWKQSPQNLAYWFEKDGKLYLKLNIGNIISQSMNDAGQSGATDIAGVISMILDGDAATIKGLLGGMLKVDLSTISDKTFNTLLDWVKNGVPLNIKTVDGHTCIYLSQSDLDMLFASPVSAQEDPKFAEKSDFGQLIKLLTPMIPKEYAMAVSVFNQIPQLWPTTEQFDLGLDLIAK